MIWFCSDTHFAHRNIVLGVSEWSDKSGCRNFPTTDAHDQMLLGDINAAVGPEDCLYHLGDWSFGGQSNIEKYRHQILCRNVNIMLGNHDHWISRKKDELVKKGIFNSVRKYHELDCEWGQFVLCHYPIENWNNQDRGAIHLHGHVHGNGRKIDGRYDMGYEMHWLASAAQMERWPKASKEQRRHVTLHGGNQFGD